MTDNTHMEPTDDELDELRQANSGRLNFVTFREFRVIARAALAKWGARQPVECEPLTDAQIKGLIADGVFFGNCKEIVRAIEAAHGIKKGGQHVGKVD